MILLQCFIIYVVLLFVVLNFVIQIRSDVILSTHGSMFHFNECGMDMNITQDVILCILIILRKKKKKNYKDVQACTYQY